MSDELKFILNLAGELSPELTDVLNSCGYEIGETFESEENEKVCLILVRGVKSLKKVEELELDNVPLISIGHIENIRMFFKQQGKMILDEGALQNGVVAKVLKKYFSQDSSLQTESIYKDVLESTNSMKLTNLLTLGYYNDIIITDAFKGGFNTISMRNYLTAAMSYFSYLSSVDRCFFPIDVTYGQSEETFMVQTFAEVDEFFAEHVWDSLKGMENDHPYKGLVQILVSQCDLIDIYVLESTSKLVITGVWIKENKNVTSRKFTSVLMDNLHSFSHAAKRGENLSLDVIIKLIRDELTQEATDLPGEGPKLLLEKDTSIDFKSLLFASQVVKYIVKTRAKEELPIPEADLSLDDIYKYCEGFPDQESLEVLGEVEYDFVLKAIVDADARKDLDFAVGKIKSQINVNEYKEFMLGALENLDVDGINSILKSDTIIVSGRFDEDGDENTLVKGSPDDFFDKEAWELKRLNVVEKIKEKFDQPADDDLSVDQVDTDILDVLSGEFDIDDDQLDRLMADLSDDAINGLTFEELQLPEGLRDTSEEKKIEAAINMRDRQIEKMSKALELMKEKMKLLAEKSEDVLAGASSGDLSSEEKRALISSKNEISQLQGELSKRERELEKAKQSTTFALEHKDKKIEELQNRINVMQQDGPTEGKMFAQEAGEIKQHNDVLKKQLEMSEKQLTIMSENMERLKNSGKSKLNVELTQLREKNNLAQTAMKKFHQEKMQLEARLRMMGADLQVSKPVEFADAPNVENELEKKDKMIESLNQAVRNNELRVKESHLQLKRMEQKLISMNGQTTKGAQAIAASAAGGLSKRGSGADAIKVKQLETVLGKLQELNGKSQKDLAKKKKELIQMQSENTTLKNKLEDMEKQLKRYKRHAA